jgi:hypothetical protein
MYAISEKPGVAYTNYFQDSRGNFSLTLTSRHTCYASLSNLNEAVPICDRVGQRSVNRAVSPSMKGCEKSFIHGLNPRFTVLNS